MVFGPCTKVCVLLIHTWLQPADVQDSIRIGNRFKRFPGKHKRPNRLAKAQRVEKGWLCIMNSWRDFARRAIGSG